MTAHRGHRPLTVQLRLLILNGIDGDTQREQNNYQRRLKHLLSIICEGAHMEDAAYRADKHWRKVHEVTAGAA